MEGTFADPRFGVFRYLSLIYYRCYLVGNRRGYLPRDGLDLRDFTRIQQRVSGATVRGPDIESDDKLSRKARVTGADCLHDGSQRRAMGRSNISLGPATLFFYIKVEEACRPKTCHIEVDPIKSKSTYGEGDGGGTPDTAGSEEARQSQRDTVRAEGEEDSEVGA